MVIEFANEQELIWQRANELSIAVVEAAYSLPQSVIFDALCGGQEQLPEQKAA